MELNAGTQSLRWWFSIESDHRVSPLQSNNASTLPKHTDWTLGLRCLQRRDLPAHVEAVPDQSTKKHTNKSYMCKFVPTRLEQTLLNTPINRATICWDSFDISTLRIAVGFPLFATRVHPGESRHQCWRKWNKAKMTTSISKLMELYTTCKTTMKLWWDIYVYTYSKFPFFYVLFLARISCNYNKILRLK